MHRQPGRPEPLADVGELRAAPAPAVDLRLRVAAVADEVAGIRQAVKNAAQAHGGSDRLIADIALAVTEACANVVTHAYRHAAEPGPLAVEAYRENGDFVVVVSDEGTGVEPPADSPGLGLGLALIARLTRRMEIGTNPPRGATILMAFALSG
jgi:serine/threonine-protein kinase RsbW